VALDTAFPFWKMLAFVFLPAILRYDSQEASLTAGDARLGDAAVCTCAVGNYSAAGSLFDCLKDQYSRTVAWIASVREDTPMAFPSTEDIVSIELVAQHPALYDLKHAQYKVHNVGENVGAEIGEKLGKTCN
jgi:hypothetical protein